MKSKGWYWAIQLVLAVVVAWFVWKTLASHWTDFRSLSFSGRVRIPQIVAAAVAVWAAYALLVVAWRVVLRGWGAYLRLPSAIRIWCVSNLGRYLPGKVWSAAGLALLAQREGVPGWAAAGAAVVMQALAVGTGVAVVAAGSPGAATPASLTAALLVALAVTAVLVLPASVRLIRRLLGDALPLEPLPLSAVALGAGAASVGWILYGLAFWLLALGLVPQAAPPLLSAIGIFAAGYIVGLIAVFAPGGLGVRESVFFVLLTPLMGAGAAAVLTVASRILMTVTEVTAALGALAWVRGPRREERREHIEEQHG
jgi:glycosyltransferase 2 family protein